MPFFRGAPRFQELSIVAGVELPLDLALPSARGGGGGGVHILGDRRATYQDHARGPYGGIKVTQKQIVNEKTSRRRTAQKDKKTRKKRVLSEYTKVKKLDQARIRSERAKKYKQLNEKIKQLPQKQKKKRIKNN